MGDDHIEHRMLSRGIENAQKRIENRNFDARKNLLEYAILLFFMGFPLAVSNYKYLLTYNYISLMLKVDECVFHPNCGSTNFLGNMLGVLRTCGVFPVIFDDHPSSISSLQIPSPQ